MKHIKLVYIVSAAFIIAGLSGCTHPGKVTGGGWIPSVEEGGKANFGFNADSCDAYYSYREQEWFGIKGKFNFHDKNDDVKMQGDVVGVMDCTGIYPPSECTVNKYENDEYKCGGYLVQLDYRSTNPKVERGVGTAWACFYDNGEGANATDSDEVFFHVEDGPFEDYSNHGEVQGNIQAHECDEEEE